MADLQILSMAPQHKKKIFNGSKRITIRDKERPQFKVGDTISIESADGTWGCKTILTGVSFQTYAATPLVDIEDDGFTSVGDMIIGMRSYYPHIVPSSKNTVLRWGGIFEVWEK